MIPRWHATITYRSEVGMIPVEYDIEELSGLADLVEHGPHWDAIDNIAIKLRRPAEERPITIEEAERL